MWDRVCAALAAGVAVITCLYANVASAGKLEEFTQLLLHPKDPNVMVARYENGGNGAFYTADGGKTWKTMCASMIAPGERADGAMTMTADGHGLVSFFGGLWQGGEGGCSWSKATE